MIERKRNGAGEHIDFIAVGYSDQHIRIFSTGFRECCWFRRVTFDCTDIEALLQLAQCGFRAVNNSDVVLLVGEVLG